MQTARLGLGDSKEPLSKAHDRAVLWAGALDPSREGFERTLQITPARLDPHEQDVWKSLFVERAKSEVLSCAYLFLRGFYPPYNTFSSDLRHIKPESQLGKYLEAEGTFRNVKTLAAYAELGMWITADGQPIRTCEPDALPQKQQLHEWAMPEADADALGAAYSSLALELISLVVENVNNTPDPSKALFDTAQTGAASTTTPDNQSSGTSLNSLRSRLAKKAEQQQLKRAEDEWLQKTKHIQVSQRMRWRDLLVVLSNLFGFFKPDASICRTFWRLVVSAHVAASVCRMLGLVFLKADNREPLVLRLLACSSAEELAGVLTTQISSMVRKDLVAALYM
ncbi:hypothetical protein DUNSADRAFT_14203 [Dunaliella salina]|uniref:Uncharacterized protein n=1 Tax=Dunaliella salina TaxID=3046 RepID=A0ABQ7G7T8_DUNSA|nr:hypothetical protein DUNSADRAFT_14203 [Dunaliella salina]|eukprot:KAF5830665.1 hypothetical protein DUNSADRAFT_14203 [Dunaliella salina]